MISVVIIKLKAMERALDKESRVLALSLRKVAFILDQIKEISKSTGVHQATIYKRPPENPSIH